MNKKVLVVDYDRTLFINNSDMLNNINSINKFRENGNIFIIALFFVLLYIEINMPNNIHIAICESIFPKFWV